MPRTSQSPIDPISPIHLLQALRILDSVLSATFSIPCSFLDVSQLPQFQHFSYKHPWIYATKGVLIIARSFPIKGKTFFILDLYPPTTYVHCCTSLTLTYHTTTLQYFKQPALRCSFALGLRTSDRNAMNEPLRGRVWHSIFTTSCSLSFGPTLFPIWILQFYSLHSIATKQLLSKRNSKVLFSPCHVHSSFRKIPTFLALTP